MWNCENMKPCISSCLTFIVWSTNIPVDTDLWQAVEQDLRERVKDLQEQLRPGVVFWIWPLNPGVAGCLTHQTFNAIQLAIQWVLYLANTRSWLSRQGRPVHIATRSKHDAHEERRFGGIGDTDTHQQKIDLDLRQLFAHVWRCSS